MNVMSTNEVKPRLVGIDVAGYGDEVTQQKVPVGFAVMLRKEGAIYYAASGSSQYEHLHGRSCMRPLAIDPWTQTPAAHNSVHYSLLTRIGYPTDAPASIARVRQPVDPSCWYGTAHFADSLSGAGALHDSAAQIGGRWRVAKGEFLRTAAGASAMTADSLALADTGVPCGLVHMLFTSASGTDCAFRFLWRYRDQNNYWSVATGIDGCRLDLWKDGVRHTVAVDAMAFVHCEDYNALQLLDDGIRFSIYLNGDRLFGQSFVDDRLAQAVGIGLQAETLHGALTFRSFEAHPREVSISLERAAEQQGKRLQLTLGRTEHLLDDFAGAAADLAGRLTTPEARPWQHTLGAGHIRLTGGGVAQVHAEPTQQAHDRIAYTAGWTTPEFADVAADILPPGTGPRQSQRSRAGVILWMDEDTYLIVCISLDDVHTAASAVSILHLDGHEERNALGWVDVGQKAAWGKVHRLRLVSDGLRYAVSINDSHLPDCALAGIRPADGRLRIERVGIVSSWQWGADTGSRFVRFVAKAY